jgi:formylglycine-generating enzyme required for sulfatase activity
MNNLAQRNSGLIVAGTFFVLTSAGAGTAPSQQVLRDCPACPAMVVVPAGSFSMGSPADEPLRHANEGPQSTVHIASFAVGETEVTRAQYADFVRETKRQHTEGCVNDPDGDAENAGLDPAASFASPGFAQQDDHPAVCVSWQEATDYAAWLSRKTGKRYRLPSESEWEYAARGGARTAFFWGTRAEDGCRYMNAADQTYRRGMPKDVNLKVECDDGVVLTAPVGRYLANAFGLHDVTGNAWELVEDCYVPSLSGVPTDGSPRQSDACAEHPFRGGSFNDYPEDFRLARRQHVPASQRWANIGFRIARDLAPAEKRP